MKEKQMDSPPCIVCGGTLENIDREGNQPNRALEFTTQGHYGSAAFDPMDGSGLAINVCDTCLTVAKAKERVLRWQPIAVRTARTKYEIWE
jgi:hypothetical protein